MSTTARAKGVKVKRLKMSEMTPVQRRVAIAKDVLKQLRLGHYSAEAGLYLDIIMPSSYDYIDVSLQQECDAAREGTSKSCEVCALGAAMVSAAGLFNRLGHTTSLCFSDIYRYLGKFFPKRTLMMMEVAFEMHKEHGTLFGHRSLSFDETQACYDFGKRYHSDASRLNAIMANIVANKGDFDPAWRPAAKRRPSR